MAKTALGNAFYSDIHSADELRQIQDCLRILIKEPFFASLAKTSATLATNENIFEAQTMTIAQINETERKISNGYLAGGADSKTSMMGESVASDNTATEEI